ncbi:hypothetical protein I317_03240 [Kwoniella heveanensis CBS 569]|nr:hypothetical protein I317_03240 [Kwoniella heveanensis CBS 569]
MPKPTFLQSVLQKPTRSYADPYHSSPWADQEQDQSSRGFGYGYARPSRYDQVNNNYTSANSSYAGPSRQPRPGVPSSTVSASAMSDGPSMGTRFPKPARKVASSVTLQDGRIVHSRPPNQDQLETKSRSRSELGVASTSGRRKKDTSRVIYGEDDGWATGTASQSRSPSAMSGKAAGTGSGTIKKKKKKPRAISAGVDDAASSILPSPISVSTTTSLKLSPPIPIHSRYSETSASSSGPSSPIPPLSPAMPTHERVTQPIRPASTVIQQHQQQQYQKPSPLLTPPSSKSSTPNPSYQAVPLAAPRPAERANKPLPGLLAQPIQSQKTLSASETRKADIDTDDEEDVFYTPRSSLVDLSVTDTSTIGETETATPKPPLPLISPPSFNFLPPTPAPVPDPDVSPFHSGPSSSSSSSLHPDRPSQRPSPRIEIPSNLRYSAGLDSETPLVDEDAQSDFGEVGSDDEEERAREQGGHSRQTSGSIPTLQSRGSASQPPSVVSRSHAPSSVVDGYRPPSRQSTSRRASRNEFDDFVVHRRGSRPVSEASFGSAPVVAGSVSGSISGYGKGGWAAAHSARSRPASPVMYMPTTGDGWTGFHQPPPPRQSKFTPLPSASLAPTFDRITNGSRLEGSSAQGGSQNGGGFAAGGLRPPSRDSSPSEYSQLSDGLDGLPQPSRSYVKKDYASEASQSSALSDGERERSGPAASTSVPPPPPPGSLVFPIARVGSLSVHQNRNQTQSHNRAPSSRPMSPVPPGFSRPTSPLPDTSSPVLAASPRTFNPPSFLDPDLLTVLPEMSHEDSEKLYRPAPSESGRSRRASMQDWNSYNPSRRSSIFRAKSEVGGHRSSRSERGGDDDEDGLGELPTVPRSKSVIGFRGDVDRKWEGSTYGDGVLMESNGRAPESVGGYTNLILPAGAYRPNNPAKSRSELDSRILGIPHATMASITLSTTHARHAATPAHLRDQLPSLVDFNSHLKPPTKVNDHQLLVQVYAVAIDQVDVDTLGEKGRGDVGKWVPGRSFVGRALVVGADEKEVVRGDIVMGLVDVRRSGALCEYILVDRRRISRAPFPTQLTLEQLSLLPLQGIAAARAVRGHLVRHSRALIMDAHTGIAALVCQELSRAGVHVTAVIPGGDDSHDAHRLCLSNGARGVLMGSPASVMLNMEEMAWDYVFDTHGGQRVYDAARRMLKDGGKIVSTVKPETAFPSAPPHLTSRPSGLKTLRAAFTSSKRKESKFIAFEYLPPSGTGEPEVDTSGMDCRDVMEEPCMAIFKPHLPDNALPSKPGEAAMGAGYGGQQQRQEMKSVVHFERGADVFKKDWRGYRVVRVIN